MNYFYDALEIIAMLSIEPVLVCIALVILATVRDKAMLGALGCGNRNGMDKQKYKKRCRIVLVMLIIMGDVAWAAAQLQENKRRSPKDCIGDYAGSIMIQDDLDVPLQLTMVEAKLYDYDVPEYIEIYLEGEYESSELGSVNITIEPDDENSISTDYFKLVTNESNLVHSTGKGMVCITIEGGTDKEEGVQENEAGEETTYTYLTSSFIYGKSAMILTMEMLDRDGKSLGSITLSGGSVQWNDSLNRQITGVTSFDTIIEDTYTNNR